MFWCSRTYCWLCDFMVQESQKALKLQNHMVVCSGAKEDIYFLIMFHVKYKMVIVTLF